MSEDRLSDVRLREIAVQSSWGDFLLTSPGGESLAAVEVVAVASELLSLRADAKLHEESQGILMRECGELRAEVERRSAADPGGWKATAFSGMSVIRELRDQLAALRATAARREKVAHDGLLGEIMAELDRATAKFPTWPTDPLHAHAVFGEEFGELGKAILECVYEYPKSDKDDVRKEAIQAAAMAFRFAMSLNQYEYAKGPQHSQSPLSARAAAPPASDEGKGQSHVISKGFSGMGWDDEIVPGPKPPARAASAEPVSPDEGLPTTGGTEDGVVELERRIDSAATILCHFAMQSLNSTRDAFMTSQKPNYALRRAAFEYEDLLREFYDRAVAVAKDRRARHAVPPGQGEEERDAIERMIRRAEDAVIRTQGLHFPGLNALSIPRLHDAVTQLIFTLRAQMALAKTPPTTAPCGEVCKAAKNLADDVLEQAAISGLLPSGDFTSLWTSHPKMAAYRSAVRQAREGEGEKPDEAESLFDELLSLVSRGAFTNRDAAIAACRHALDRSRSVI